MTIWKTKENWFTTVCVPCKLGLARRDRAAVLEWAIRHAQRHSELDIFP